MNIRGEMLIIALVAGFFIVFFLVSQKPLYVDEITHFSAISNFCKFNFTYPPWLTTIPGYHFFSGLFGALTSCTENFIRFFNMLISLVSVVVAFFISKKITQKSKNLSREKAFVTALLPILVPFFFLIYTDVMSMFFVLLMFYFTLKDSHFIAGIFGLLSFVVRQNNVLWILFCLVYVFHGNKSTKFIHLKDVKMALPYLIVLLIGAGFFVKNGGFAIGDLAQHPTFFLGPMNIYCALFFLFWLNLPEHIFNFTKIKRLIEGLGKRNIILICSILLSFVFFLYTFKVDHPYNSYQIYSYFLRNKLLHVFDSSVLLRSVFFVFVAYSALSLAVTKFREKRQYMLYPFSVLVLAASWLIEIRYYIIPFVLYNLFAVREKKVERCLIAWYLIVTVGYFYLWLSGWTFW